MKKSLSLTTFLFYIPEGMVFPLNLWRISYSFNGRSEVTH